ncbi:MULTISPECIES: RnfH family protein [unclassified Arsukibacterium]|uniref:RnfH family protein n=1 Tax=unclassified Arsukibacterium TaxID=2635278 RepID=UPI000C5DD896|nr:MULTISPECIES: RnfH family protein [unclassified Arsukibacterium]MAA94202.1 RnfH family protein [Rheinheimera sp.]MBM34453.1 RnfH family protein [Rheinheimera sp.]HAW93965.1 RnfH family protein [Candidatus Azambacteria bacterium]|tara:strand:+ start:257 stop:589 length:333 start_codon:yes stop_codon:yes gene_type:complete
MAEHVTVEVAYALPTQQSLLTITVPIGSTVMQVIEQSGILQQYPEIDLSQQKIGVWSRPVKHDEQVNDGDRIEIYRPLIADPKDLRRRRAEKAKEEGRADKVTGGRKQEH